MPSRFKQFLQRWAITTVAVVLAEWTVPGLQCGNWKFLVVGALILGMLNAVLRPLMVVTSLGFMAALNVAIGVKAALLGGALGLLAAEVVYLLLHTTPWWWLWGALAGRAPSIPCGVAAR